MRLVLAIQCKASSSHFDPAALRSFRHLHPQGDNLVVCLDLVESLSTRVGGMPVRFVPFEQLDRELDGNTRPV